MSSISSTLNTSKSFDEPSVIFEFLQYGVCFISIFYNILLINLIYARTPAHFKSYAIMLLFMCVYEINTIFASFMLFTRIISLGTDGILCVLYGPCHYFNCPPAICFCLYSLLLNGFTYYNIQMTASFSYRYYVLRHSSPSIRTTVVMNLIMATPTTICFLGFCSASLDVVDKEQLDSLLEHHLPQYNLSGATYFGIIDPLHSPIIGTIVFVILTAFPCLTINICAGASIHRYLNSKAVDLAVKTRRMHREFLHALLWNLLISQLFIVCIIFFLLGQFEIIRHPLLEYGVHFLGEICIVISPIVTIYFVKPYRTSALRFVGVISPDSRDVTAVVSTARISLRQ